eukprot:8497271-Alexandrium_andersonii.AAC.1
MSASLVGSEMCIRDSRLAARLGTGAGAWLCRSFCLGAVPIAVALASSWPVSYTHLTLPTICSV